MLENLTRQWANAPLHQMIPDASKKWVGVELSALVLESLYWRSETKTPEDQDAKATILGVLKAVQVATCLGSVPFLQTNARAAVFGFAAGSVVFYTHMTARDKDNSIRHRLASTLTFFLNVTAKVVNSAMIGRKIHQIYFKDAPPGPVMYATTFAALGVSSYNVIKEWSNLSTLRGDTP